MATAYVRIRGSYTEELVTYTLGPVWVEHTLKTGWYRDTGFVPQAKSISGGTSTATLMGNGTVPVGAVQAAGPIVQYASSGTPAFVAPDEMEHTPPRTLEHGLSYLTFYGATLPGTGFTRSLNELLLGALHAFKNGQIVTVSSTGALPAGLLANTLYYVVAVTSTAFSVALTAGGAAVTLSDFGSGTHTVTPHAVVGEFPANLNPRWSNGTASLIV